MARVWYLRELRFARRSGHATLAPPLSGRWTVQPAPQELSNRACGRPRNTSRGGIGATLSFVILPSLLAGVRRITLKEAMRAPSLWRAEARTPSGSVVRLLSFFRREDRPKQQDDCAASARQMAT